MTSRGEVVREWAEAELRLYPIINARPDLYEVALTTVRSLADHLATIPDLDSLITSYTTASRSQDLEAAGVAEDALPPEFDTDMARGAAYQLRSRELTQRAAQENALRAIVRARSAGQPTATVWSYGTNELTPPYRAVEMAVATGFAVVRSTELDPDTMRPHFVLEAVQLDPDTGNDEGHGPLVERQEFTDLESWRAAADQLRDRLLTPKET